MILDWYHFRACPYGISKRFRCWRTEGVFFRYKSGLKFTTRILPMRSLILLGSNTFRS